MNEDFIIKQGDCIELMKFIEDKSIDFILCDLPYGTTPLKWDTLIPYDKLWYHYERIIKDNGAICLFSQMPFTITLAYSNLKLFRYEYIWQKNISTGHLNSHKMPLKIHENILVFYKKLPTYNPQMRIIEDNSRCGEIINSSRKTEKMYGAQRKTTYIFTDKRYPTDILVFGKDKKTWHTSQKPLKLLEFLIKTYTNENDTVLDNCMGSGSTGIACAYTGRKFIGIEKDETIFKLAKEMVSNAFNERIKQEWY